MNINDYLMNDWHPYNMQGAIILGSKSLNGGKTLHDVLYYALDDEVLVQYNGEKHIGSWRNEYEMANTSLALKKCMFTDSEIPNYSRDTIIDIALLLINHKYKEALEYIINEPITTFNEIGFLYHHNVTILLNKLSKQ